MKGLAIIIVASWFITFTVGYICGVGAQPSTVKFVPRQDTETYLCMMLGTQPVKVSVSSMVKLGGVREKEYIKIVQCRKDTKLSEVPDLVHSAEVAMGF